MRYQIIIEISFSDIEEFASIITKTLNSCQMVFISEIHYVIIPRQRIEVMELIQLILPIFNEHPDLLKKALIIGENRSFDDSVDFIYKLPLYGLFLVPEIKLDSRYSDAFKFEKYTLVKQISECEYYSQQLLNQELMNNPFYRHHTTNETELSTSTIQFYDLFYSKF